MPNLMLSNLLTGLVIFVLAAVFVVWHVSRVSRIADREYDRGERAGYEDAYVEVWNAVFHRGSLTVPGPKGTPHEGSTVTIQGHMRPGTPGLVGPPRGGPYLN